MVAFPAVITHWLMQIWQDEQSLAVPSKFEEPIDVFLLRHPERALLTDGVVACLLTKQVFRILFKAFLDPSMLHGEVLNGKPTAADVDDGQFVCQYISASDNAYSPKGTEATFKKGGVC